MFESNPELEVYYCRIGENNHAEVAQNEVQNLFQGKARILSAGSYDAEQIETVIRITSRNFSLMSEQEQDN